MESTTGTERSFWSLPNSQMVFGKKDSSQEEKDIHPEGQRTLLFERSRIKSMHKLVVHLPQGICVLFNEFFVFFVVNDGSSEVADSIVPERLLFFFFFALFFVFEFLHQTFKVALFLSGLKVNRTEKKNLVKLQITKAETSLLLLAFVAVLLLPL